MSLAYLNASAVRKVCKENGKRAGRDFMFNLNAKVCEFVQDACKVHNGGRVTLDAAVAGIVGAAPKKTA